MFDYSNITPDQFAMTSYTADPLTGMPTTVTRHVPVIDDDGLISLEPTQVRPHAPRPPPPQASTPTTTRSSLRPLPAPF